MKTKQSISLCCLQAHNRNNCDSKSLFVFFQIFFFYNNNRDSYVNHHDCLPSSWLATAHPEMKTVCLTAVRWKLPEDIWPSICLSAAMQPIRDSQSNLGIHVGFAVHQCKRMKITGWKITKVPHGFVSLTGSARNLLKWAQEENSQKIFC